MCEVGFFMATDCRLKGILADRQNAWWILVGTAVYAVLSMEVIPAPLAVTLAVPMIIGAVYGCSYLGVEPLVPAHTLLFPGLQPTPGEASAPRGEDHEPSELDTGLQPEVTPRNPSESGSGAKIEMGSSGTTKASSKEEAPLETPDATPMKLALPAPLTMTPQRLAVDGCRPSDEVEHEQEQAGEAMKRDSSPGPQSIPMALRDALSFKGDEAMRFRVKGTFLHVEYPQAEDGMSDDLGEHVAASREGSVEASVLSGSEEGSITGAADSSDSREAAAAGRRRFRRRRSISDADLTYTAYLAELAMEQEGASVDSGMSPGVDAAEDALSPKSDSAAVDAVQSLSSEESPRDGQPVELATVTAPDRKLNPNAPEFIPQYMNRPWLSMAMPPPPGIGHRRTGRRTVYENMPFALRMVVGIAAGAMGMNGITLLFSVGHGYTTHVLGVYMTAMSVIITTAEFLPFAVDTLVPWMPFLKHYGSRAVVYLLAAFLCMGEEMGLAGRCAGVLMFIGSAASFAFHRFYPGALDHVLRPGNRVAVVEDDGMAMGLIGENPCA
ncbi:hypothetical protein FOZ61_008885 [Perkinsus olseni]|uniref:Uncharacterized protein n=1 Tax=Perkinsus olseni TaxID=32597 RepID=A0A7J6MNH5_PEROL|nr:hypothetical protein FOZ61_008885 [Perkinsus olseni]KAF4673149.1 hypothetical protein FOL46_007747 [Perkinsus olseni]